MARLGLVSPFTRVCPPSRAAVAALPASQVGQFPFLSSSQGARRTSCVLLPAAVRFDRSGNTSESRGPPLSFQAGAHPGSSGALHDQPHPTPCPAALFSAVLITLPMLSPCLPGWPPSCSCNLPAHLSQVPGPGSLSFLEESYLIFVSLQTGLP